MSPNSKRSKTADSRVPLTPAVFHIMLALSVGEAHGYAIMREVEVFSRGRVNLGPGTLYRSIQRMQVDGLIEETSGPDDPSDDERRRYYKLTKSGWEVARAEAERLASLVEISKERALVNEDFVEKIPM